MDKQITENLITSFLSVTAGSNVPTSRIEKLRNSIMERLSDICPITFNRFLSTEPPLSEKTESDLILPSCIAMIVEGDAAFLFDSTVLQELVKKHKDRTNPMTKKEFSMYYTTVDQIYVINEVNLSTCSIMETYLELVRAFNVNWRQDRLPIHLKLPEADRLRMWTRIMMIIAKNCEILRSDVMQYVVFMLDLSDELIISYDGLKDIIALLDQNEFIAYMTADKSPRRQSFVTVLLLQNKVLFCELLSKKSSTTIREIMTKLLLNGLLSSDIMILIEKHSVDITDLLRNCAELDLYGILRVGFVPFSHCLVRTKLFGTVMFQQQSQPAQLQSNISLDMLYHSLILVNSNKETVFHWLMEFEPQTAFTAFQMLSSDRQLQVHKSLDVFGYAPLHWLSYVNPTMLDKALIPELVSPLLTILCAKDRSSYSILHRLAQNHPKLLVSNLLHCQSLSDFEMTVCNSDNQGNSVAHWLAFYHPRSLTSFLTTIPSQYALKICDLKNSEQKTVLDVLIVPRKVLVEQGIDSNALSMEIQQWLRSQQSHNFQ